MKGAARIFIGIPALLALTWSSAQALRIGSADAIVYQASKEMGTWAASGVHPAQATMAAIHSDLVQAQSREPADPTVLELLGVLESQWHERPELLGAAITHFENALRYRPTSPYTWGNLAEMKYRTGDTSRTFQVALARAAQMGPNEPEVQRIVADRGLAAWDVVAPETRRAVDRAVEIGMRRDPAGMLRIADKHGRLGVACSHVTPASRLPEPKWSHIRPGREASR